MIPYLEWHTIDLGILHIQVWGLFVGLGFLLGAYAAASLAKHRGLNAKIVYDILPWFILAAMVGGRLGQVIFYDWSYYVINPLEIFAIWKGGLSMFGGLLACLLVGVWYLRKYKVDFFAYADVLAFGLPFGIWLGRLGCFFIHDHPGTATHFILGTRYSDGVVRHDLGLDESLAALLMVGVFLVLVRQSRPVGTYLALFSVWYGGLRFGLDFLRIVDTRYFGLTPGQYFGLGLIVTGLGLGVWIRKGLKKA